MRLPAAAALGSLLALLPGGAAGDDAPIRKLHVLLAVDTASNLKESVEIDQNRMTRLFKANVPADRLEIKTLTDTQLTSANVLKHYKATHAGPDDALLFFYAGHGAKDPVKGNAFVPQMMKTPPIFRSEVRDAMKQTGAGLVVLLTDCCSTKMKLVEGARGRDVWATGAPGKAIHPTLEALFFRHKGVVDVTAASDGQASWSDLENGGVFTRTLESLLKRPPVALDADRDGVLTWKEFYPLLQKESSGTFIKWSDKMRKLGEDIDQRSQVPMSFSLGQVARSPAPPKPVPSKSAGGGTEPAAPAAAKPEPPAAKVHAVISLVNESGEEVRYKFRWADAEPWQSAVLAANKWNDHSTPLGEAARTPPFQIQFEGGKTVSELEADTWTGDVPPARAAGREYPIRLRK